MAPRQPQKAASTNLKVEATRRMVRGWISWLALMIPLVGGCGSACNAELQLLSKLVKVHSAPGCPPKTKPNKYAKQKKYVRERLVRIQHFDADFGSRPPSSISV
jgi:hypothetical protein